MGRPLEFDLDEALDGALEVFWSKGYEGASIADLTAAMGINRPSLYAAFGDKAALFQKAIARYTEGPAAYVKAALDEPSARAVVERILFGAANLLADPRRPRGCLLVQGALAGGQEAEGVRRTLASQRKRGEAALRNRFERARMANDMPANLVPADLARYLLAVIQGMSVQAVGGAGREELRKVAELALRIWPAKPSRPSS